MASRMSIQMDFERAKRKADELDGIANSLRSLADNSMDNSLNNLHQAWTGENAEAFVNKGYALRDKITVTARQIQDTASAIREIAQNIYNSEMEALRIAEERDAATRVSG